MEFSIVAVLVAMFFTAIGFIVLTWWSNTRERAVHTGVAAFAGLLVFQFWNGPGGASGFLIADLIGFVFYELASALVFFCFLVVVLLATARPFRLTTERQQVLVGITTGVALALIVDAGLFWNTALWKATIPIPNAITRTAEDRVFAWQRQPERVPWISLVSGKRLSSSRIIPPVSVSKAPYSFRPTEAWLFGADFIYTDRTRVSVLFRILRPGAMTLESVEVTPSQQVTRRGSPTQWKSDPQSAPWAWLVERNDRIANTPQSFKLTSRRDGAVVNANLRFRSGVSVQWSRQIGYEWFRKFTPDDSFCRTWLSFLGQCY